jgi:hypothetical protein
MNSSVQRLLAVFAMLLLSPLAAHAISYDPKELARYDLSYAQCESQYPQMKGRRDQAYVAIWRLRSSDKTVAQLAKVRKGATYKTERERALKAAPNGVLAASSPLAHQCEALWNEAQKFQAPATPKKP